MTDTVKGAASAPAPAATPAPTPAHGIVAEIEGFISRVEHDVGAIPSDAWRIIKAKLAELKAHL